jgi:hypothetical protein
MGMLNTCFNSLSSIQSVSYNQRYNYKIAWDSFRTIELFNSNVSTQRGQGNKNLNYYQFSNTQGQTEYKQGASLFYYYLGYVDTVKKN